MLFIPISAGIIINPLFVHEMKINLPASAISHVLVDPSRVSIYKHILGGHITPQERTLITRVITRDKCSQTQDEVCSEETVKVNGRQILSQAECKKQFQLICRAVRQFKAITGAAEYIRRTFNEIKREFLSVIDHLKLKQKKKILEKEGKVMKKY